MTLIDIALCKPAHQSSFSKWSTEAGAAGVLQRAGGYFGFHTEIESSPWWEVDLLNEYPIYKIVLHNRLNGFLENASTIKVEISCDRNAWKLIHAGWVCFSDVDSNSKCNVD